MSSAFPRVRLRKKLNAQIDRRVRMHVHGMVSEFVFVNWYVCVCDLAFYLMDVLILSSFYTAVCRHRERARPKRTCCHSGAHIFFVNTYARRSIRC